MRIAMVASECEPFAKTGGLADVVDALARALGRSGHQVDVFLPSYRGLVPPAGGGRAVVVVPLGRAPNDEPDTPTSEEVSILSAPADGYRLRLVEHAPSFDRDGYYGYGTRDFADNAARFTLLGRAALEAIRAEGGGVDVLHGHDWQSGPAILSLRSRYAADPLLARMAVVLTCHNLAYHGWTPRAVAWQLDLTGTFGDADGVDLLREAVGAADMVNTVSPSFARESLTPEFGAGLDDVLRGLGERYTGIINGIDPSLWDPATDQVIARAYSADDPTGKADCRVDLCSRAGLDPGGTLFGVVGRLDPQKGFDLVADAAPALLEAGARLVVLGTGDRALVAGLAALASERPDRVAVLERFDREEARRIYAGADVFVMPSRFEPSGQGQLIALRYGTPPLVRLTGGLADTVVDADAEPGSGTGFCFGPTEPGALFDAALRAIAAHADPARWRAIQRRGMTTDVSWDRPARSYEAMMGRAVELRAARIG